MSSLNTMLLNDFAQPSISVTNIESGTGIVAIKSFAIISAVFSTESSAVASSSIRMLLLSIVCVTSTFDFIRYISTSAWYISIYVVRFT